MKYGQAVLQPGGAMPGVDDVMDAFRELRDLLGAPLLALTQAMCTSFKQQLLQGRHNFTNSGGHNFYIALFNSAATYNETTANYSSANEVPNGSGYTTGGVALTRVDPTTSGNTAFTDFADVSWANASFTARGAVIYNQSYGNSSVAVLDFGSDKTVTSGTFTIVFPAADAGNAILRIA